MAKKTNVRITFSLNSQEFQEQMKAAKRELNEIDASFALAKAEAKAFGKQSDVTRASIEGLTVKITAQKNKIALVEKEYRRLGDVLSDLKKETPGLKEKVDAATEAYEKSKKELGANAEATKELKKELDKAKQSYADNAENIKNCVKKQSDMKVELDKSKTSLVDMQGEVKKLNEEMARAPWDKFASGCEKVSDVVGKIGRGLSVASGAVVGLGTTSAKAAIDYETAFAGVKKTVDATPEQLEDISDGIKNMAKNIPATTTEIAGVAKAAGQLGIATDDILDFSRVMIDLGVSTNLSSDEAASALAKFANVTQMEAKNYSNLGSVIVSLGNHFATTEADIVNMATRLASTGEIVGLTEPQIMAVSTALSSVGIEAEAGCSAVAKLLKKMETSVSTYDQSKKVIDQTGKSLRELQMMQNHNAKGFKALAEEAGLTSNELSKYMSNVAGLEQFAAVADKSADEFINAWGKDAVSALDLFITGLGDTERNGNNAVGILQDMGLTEVRMSNAILALSSSGGILTKAVNDANTAWAENNALSNEAAQRYGTTESRIQITKNRITDLMQMLGEKLLPTLQQVLEKVNALADRFSGLSDEQQNTIIKVGAGIAVAGPATVALSKVIGAVGSVSKVIGAAAGKIAGAGGLTKALGALASPAGIAVAAIAAIAAGLAIVYTKNEGVRKSINTAVGHLRDSVQPLLTFFTDTVLPRLRSAWDGLTEKLKSFGGFLEDAFVSVWQDMLTPAIEWLASTAIPRLTGAVENIWNNVLVPLAEFLGGVLASIWQDTLVPTIEWLATTLIPQLTEAITNIWNNVLVPLAGFLKDVFVSVWQDMLAPAIEWLATSVLPQLMEVVKNIWNNVLVPLAEFVGSVLEPVITVISDLLSVLWENIIVPLAQCIGEVLAAAWDGLCAVLNENVIPNINKAIEICRALWDDILKPIVDWLWERLKPVLTKIFEYIKAGIGTIKDTLIGLIQFITGVLTGDWEKALGGLKKVATSWWEGIKKIFIGLRNFLEDIVEKIKGIFKFEWKLPKIKLPHFKVEWDTEGALAKAAQFLGLEGMPKIGVEWYRTGGIMTEPTAFGMAGGKLLAGGEDGPEAILPLSEFYTRLAAILDDKFTKWAELHDAPTIVYVTLDGELIAVKTAKRVEKNIVREWQRSRA